jgi:hypothetical protein
MNAATGWGNPKAHTAAYQAAMEEFYRARPELRGRKLFELDRDDRTLVLARQVEIYRDRGGDESFCTEHGCYFVECHALGHGEDFDPKETLHG